MILTKEISEKINIDDIINSKIKSDSLDELLIVVPTNRKARYLKKELIDFSKNNTVSKINIETIGTLSERLLFSIKNFNSLSDAAASVFIEQSVNKEELKYFSSYKDEIPTGTLDKIKNVISEYKKQGISPEILRIEAEKLTPSEKLKATDIANIYEKFIQRCAIINAYQVGDVYQHLIHLKNQQFMDVFVKNFENVDLIVVNGFAEFTSPEIAIINKLSEVPKSDLYVNFDYYNYNPQVFSYLDNCYDKFLQVGFHKIIDETEHNERKFVKHFRESIFREVSKRHSNFNDVITKISAANRYQEVELIAKEIKSLILEKNVEPNKICVAFNLVGNYSELLRDVFTAHKIPVNLTDRIALDNSPVVIAIISFLEILENDFYYKNIIRALSSGFISINKVEINSILNASQQLKIISGKKNWQISLNEAISNEENEHPKLINVFKKALAGIETIENLLKPFSRKLAISDFYNELIKLIFDLKIVDRILEKSNDKEEENIKGLTTFIETIEEICELLKLEFGNDGKFPLSYFIKHIKIAASRARFNVKEKSDYGVLITAVNEIRGLQFDHLFLGGLNDGDFPTKYNPEIFFSGSFSKKELEHQNEERYHFYQTLCCWKKRLYLCSSMMDNNKELEESIFLKEFLKLFEVTEKSKLDFNEVLYTDEEVLIENGKNLLKDKHTEIIQNISEIEYDSLIASIKINESRKHRNDNMQNYNGIIDLEQDELKEQIDKFKIREYSVSQLEVYAKCPFKFFIERILKIETIEEPSDEIEAIEVGNILHQIMYEFYTKLKEENVVLQNCDGETFRKCTKILFDISDKHLSNISFKLPLSFIEKEKIFGSNERRDNSLLYKFLEYERNTEIYGKPMFFEAAFGSVDKLDTDKDISIDEPIQIGEIKIRGKIDRIEVNEANKSFNILDYKTGGKKPSMNELKDGLSLQLPIYLYAVEKLLKQKYGCDYNGLGMFIYSLKYNEDSFGRIEVKYDRKQPNPEDIKNHIQNSLDILTEYVNDIIAGNFHLSTLSDKENQICRFCDFKPVCRITSQKNSFN